MIPSGWSYAAAAPVPGTVWNRVLRPNPLVQSNVINGANGTYGFNTATNLPLVDSTGAATTATLTGSIGVFSGKFVVGKGLADLGITTDRTADSGFATMNSPFTPFTPDQLQRLNASLDQIYDGFIARVAAGRKLPPAAVAQAAKGRVWTGRQAKQLGLVDALGGLELTLSAEEMAALEAPYVPHPISGHA